ncbi:hypothetical protein [Neoroseomonas oryzicola]|uniref:Lipoprotein n=1 Tax=Neoroseomonas oryzicola TaxID=535904 RepID=A0A9X9WDT5_9PROT|nr:hypothetical protein [Neoroseomonas oryzicola]MBR0658495.1 hypothetical protein [Neoroseomonas oryzicola]NKE17684.1 hypothetical protein [Neoroseomonas oryzicola]
MWKPPTALLAVPLLASCTTVFEGTRQILQIRTEPAGAACELTRRGSLQATISATPANVEIGRAREPIAISCHLAGFRTSERTIPSYPTRRRYGFPIPGGGTAGEVLFAGSGFWLLFAPAALVDESTGAPYNYYPDEITLVLEPLATDTVRQDDH